MARAGDPGEGGHKPSTGEAQAESNRIAERLIATEMPWLVDRTRVIINAILSSVGLKLGQSAISERMNDLTTYAATGPTMVRPGDCAADRCTRERPDHRRQ